MMQEITEKIAIQHGLVEQLINIYYQEENWHRTKLSPKEAFKYFNSMFKKNNIFVYLKDHKVIGYCECWRVNFEQWGRIVCKAPFSAYEENVSDGNVCVVANVYIHEKYRRTRVVKSMKEEFFKRNHDAEYFVGNARRKSADLIKVFKKDELVSSLFKGGI